MRCLYYILSSLKETLLLRVVDNASIRCTQASRKELRNGKFVNDFVNAHGNV